MIRPAESPDVFSLGLLPPPVLPAAVYGYDKKRRQTSGGIPEVCRLLRGWLGWGGRAQPFR